MTLLLSFLTSPAAKYFLAAVALAGALYSAYSFIYNKGYDAAQTAYQLASMEAQAAADKQLKEATKKGDELAAQLALTQRKVNEKQAELLAYANGISGNCPASLGVLVSSASSAGNEVPGTTSKPANPPAANGSANIAASLIAVNVATNYARHAECINSLNTLIDWHSSVASQLKEAK